MRVSATGVFLGEGFAGHGADAAHVNTVFGRRDGPVGIAWASALASPSAGHVPFVAVVRPNLPVVPFTLFVPKAAVAGDRHGRLTWGAAQAGLAAGVGDALVSGDVPSVNTADHVLIAAVWVDPSAADEEAVFANNRTATAAALHMGARMGPSADEVLTVLRTEGPSNPFFRRS
jgi:5,6,7,8-tetrahydromethanopterin hydro-lyase